MDSSKIMAQQAQQGMASREKYWEELTDGEKIASLRDAVAGLFDAVSTQAETINVLRQHQHGAVGEVLTPAFGNSGSERQSSPRNVPYRLRTERERR